MAGLEELSLSERLRHAQDLKDKAADVYKRELYSEAREFWEQALGILPRDEANEEVLKLSLSLHLNLAMAALQLKDFEGVIQATEEVLKSQPENAKALYRRGLAYEAQGRIQPAASDMLKAAKLEPQNAGIRKKYEELKKKVLELREAADTGEDLDDRPPVHDLAKLPRVFLSIQVGDREPVRLVFALFSDTAPRTAENFRQLCTGESDNYSSRGNKLHFKGSLLHRMIPGLMVQGGDFDNTNGTGGESIYGRRFADETFADKHTRRGLLAMANDGPNTNGSNFFVTFAPADHLDRKHVIFGELVEGMEVLDIIEGLPTNPECRPLTDCVVVDCGDLGLP